jgi:hypothetical protein
MTPADKADIFRLSYITAMIEHMITEEPPNSRRATLYCGIRDKIAKTLDAIGMNQFTGEDVDKAMKVFETTDKAIAKAYPPPKETKTKTKE